MKKELSVSNLQRIVDFFSAGTLKKSKLVGEVDIEVREQDELFVDPITNKQIQLPLSLTVEMNLIWTTHGGYLLVSVPPQDERRALQNVQNPFSFLKKSLGLLHIQNVANFQDPKFITCHMFDKYHYLFAL